LHSVTTHLRQWARVLLLKAEFVLIQTWTWTLAVTLGFRPSINHSSTRTGYKAGECCPISLHLHISIDILLGVWSVCLKLGACSGHWRPFGTRGIGSIIFRYTLFWLTISWSGSLAWSNLQADHWHHCFLSAGWTCTYGSLHLLLQLIDLSPVCGTHTNFLLTLVCTAERSTLSHVLLPLPLWTSPPPLLPFTTKLHVRSFRVR